MSIAKIENNCWFHKNHKIVPKMSEQYLLKKDLTIGDCNYPCGMVVYVKQYVPSKEYLDLKINLK